LDKVIKDIDYEGSKFQADLTVSRSKHRCYEIAYEIYDSNDELIIRGVEGVENFDGLYNQLTKMLDDHHATIKHQQFYKELQEWDGKII